MTPSKSNCHPKALYPNLITLRFRGLTWEWGWPNSSPGGLGPWLFEHGYWNMANYTFHATSRTQAKKHVTMSLSHRSNSRRQALTANKVKLREFFNNTWDEILVKILIVFQHTLVVLLI